MNSTLLNPSKRLRRETLLAMVVWLFALGVTTLAQPAGCPSGMTHYWKFEESGSPYDDYYASSDATCTACPVQAAGRIGYGQSFDRVDDQIIVTDDNTFEWGASSSYTIEFWMQRSGCSCTEGGFNCNEVMISRFGIGGAWWIGVTCQTGLAAPPGRLRCYFGGVDIFSTVTVADGQWHHIVFQRDNTANQCRLYIDGNLDVTAGGGGADRTGTAALQIGWANASPYYRYGGILDEIALYDAVLPLTDIQAHYNSGNGQSYCSAANQAPVVGDIPDEAVPEGTAFATINLDDYVSDPDNLDSEISWSYSGDDHLTVSIVNRVATIAAEDPEWNDSETITFTATDQGSLSDSDDAAFTVTAVNDPPAVGDIPGQTVPEGTAFATINLDDYVSDPDNLDSEISWSYSGDDHLTVSIVNRVATITADDPEWNGSETITFTATDQGSLSDSDDAMFTVTAVNDSPVVGEIPSETVPEGTAFATINLDDYVSDPDNLDSEISWSYSGDDHLTVSIVNRVATITADDPEWNGSETITFTATDQGSLSDSDDATFTVTAVNDPPVVGEIPGETVPEGTAFATINLDDYVSDPDNLDSEISWSYSGDDHLTVSIVNRVATITADDPEWNGSETITFTATDQGSLSDSDDATFTVTAVNDPPVVGEIPGETVPEGTAFATINLDDYVSDPDNLDSEISWSYSGAVNLSVSIVARVATIAAIDPEWNGSETITFTATDPDLLTDSDGATFTVTAVNDPPVVGEIPGETVPEGTAFATINLDDYVSDPDNLDSEISWSYSGDDHLTVSIVNRVATITAEDPEWNGSETITFTATDQGSLSDSDDATFTVTAVNDPPVVGEIPGETVPEGTAFATINLDDYVSDPDNLDSEISWSYSGAVNLLVSIVARVATIAAIDPEWNGSETITFTATDADLLTDSDGATFTVTAVNDPPVVGEIPGETVPEGTAFATINLDDYVSDPDNLDSEISWSYSGDVNLSVSIVARVATITAIDPEWNGSETITFTATDPDLLSDSDAAQFSVLSEGCPPGMAHYWELNETVGGTYDDSFDALDATCTNCPTPVAGIVGGAQEFDRLTDQVNIADDNSYDWGVSSSFTIEFWLRKSTGCAGSAQGNNEVVIGRSGGGWWIGVMCEAGVNQSRIRAYFQGVDIFSTSAVPDDDWHLIAFVRDNAASQWLLYFDGVPEAVQTSAGKNLAAATPLSVGWYDGPDAGKYRLGGMLDELAIYNSALTQAEIENHYALGQVGLGYCQLGIAPLITSTPITTAVGNKLYTYDVEATGAPTPTFSLAVAPSGMTIDENSGLISWVPDSIGNFTVEVAATNSVGSQSQPFTISVSQLAPLITSTPVTEIEGGKNYVYDVNANAIPTATYWLFAIMPNLLPPGMTINPSSGLIEWPYAIPGTYSLNVQAFNIAGADTQSFVLHVSPVAPDIISTPILNGRTGKVYTYDVGASGVPNPVYHLLISPSGMEIDSLSGMITWLPTGVGVYSVEVDAVNSGGVDTQPYSLTIAEGIVTCSPALQHYWRFDEASGPTYANFTGSVSATCAGVCPLSEPGKVNRALRFGATNVGVSVADNGSFDWDSDDDFAIEFWMNRATVPTVDSNEVIIGRWGPQWCIGVNHDGLPSDIGKLRCSFNGTIVYSNVVVSDGLWHHIAVTRQSGQLSAYVDGVFQNSAAFAQGLVAMDPLTFGYLNTGSPAIGCFCYHGVLDEVAVYNGMLTPAEILAHYNAGNGGRYCQRCGDPDANGAWTISDAVFLITYIFGGGAAPDPELLGDADCNNLVTISDCVYMISFIFGGGPEPCAACH